MEKARKVGLGDGRKRDAGMEEHRARAPPRILYHGTCAGYVDAQLQRRGRYTNDGLPVFLTVSPVVAMSYAMTRKDYYGDTPEVLIIDTTRVDREISCENQLDYAVESLGGDSFGRCPLVVGLDGLAAEDNVVRIAVEEARLSLRRLSISGTNRAQNQTTSRLSSREA